MLFSQQCDFPGIHGLRNEKNDTWFDVAGYQIFITDVKGSVNNPKTLKKLKKKYELKTIVSEEIVYINDRECKVLESESMSEEDQKVIFHQKSFLITKNEAEITLILLQTLIPRDIRFENEFVQCYLNNDLCKFIGDGQNPVDTIYFAGREIPLGTACKWRGPNNVFCKGGQMSWAEFSSLYEALQDMNMRIQANKLRSKMSILKEEEIHVLFENVPTIAHRVVYLEKSRYGRSMPLIVYYVAQEIRGRFVSCILSNYGYNRNDYELAPLLEQVMTIPELPDSSINPFDVIAYEDNSQNDLDKENFPYTWEVRLGTWLPIGNLRNTFKTAPSVGVSLGFPIKQTMAFDIGIQFAFAVNSNQFVFYDDKKPLDAKARNMVNINLRWRYQQKIKPNVYYTTYLGIGGNTLNTNLKKGSSSKDDERYHHVSAFDAFGGINIRHKRLGCFVEYHYIPYSYGDKVKRDFGNSAFNAGIFYVFQ